MEKPKLNVRNSFGMTILREFWDISFKVKSLKENKEIRKRKKNTC